MGDVPPVSIFQQRVEFRTSLVLITFHYFGRLYDLPHDVVALVRD
jgi:hypothetical protein